MNDTYGPIEPITPEPELSRAEKRALIAEALEPMLQEVLDEENAFRAMGGLPPREGTAPLVCGEPCPHGHTHTCQRSPRHTNFHRDKKQKGTESCSWLLDEVYSMGIHSPGGPAL